MTDNELLLAISGIMDTKLKSELYPLKNDMQTMKDRMQTMEDRMQTMEDDMQAVKNDVQAVKDDMQAVKDDMQTVKDDMHKIKLCQENMILPRLSTIESCYTDTYVRYRNDAEKMEAAFTDIEIMKNVVVEHSEKLQKIS